MFYGTPFSPYQLIYALSIVCTHEHGRACLDRYFHCLFFTELRNSLLFDLEEKGSLLLLPRLAQIIISCFSFEWKSHVFHFYAQLICFLGYLSKCSDFSAQLLFFQGEAVFFILHFYSSWEKLPSDSFYLGFLSKYHKFPLRVSYLHR